MSKTGSNTNFAIIMGPCTGKSQIIKHTRTNLLIEADTIYNQAMKKYRHEMTKEEKLIINGRLKNGNIVIFNPPDLGTIIEDEKLKIIAKYMNKIISEYAIKFSLILIQNAGLAKLINCKIIAAYAINDDEVAEISNSRTHEKELEIKAIMRDSTDEEIKKTVDEIRTKNEIQVEYYKRQNEKLGILSVVPLRYKYEKFELIAGEINNVRHEVDNKANLFYKYQNVNRTRGIAYMINMVVTLLVVRLGWFVALQNPVLAIITAFLYNLAMTGLTKIIVYLSIKSSLANYHERMKALQKILERASEKMKILHKDDFDEI